MKSIFILTAFCLAICLSSCSSSKRLSHSREQATQLSRKFGFKITPRDNLQLYSAAAPWLGTPYRYGGTTRQGVDCSGLVGSLYKQVYSTTLERTTKDIAAKNCRKVPKSNLKTGNLVFFNTSRKNRKEINHVGLYLKNGYFIHASISKGVIISNLQEEYYKNTWKKGGIVK